MPAPPQARISLALDFLCAFCPSAVRVAAGSSNSQRPTSNSGLAQSCLHLSFVPSVPNLLPFVHITNEFTSSAALKQLQSQRFCTRTFAHHPCAKIPGAEKMNRVSCLLIALIVFIAPIVTSAQSASAATSVNIPTAEEAQILKTTETFVRELFAWGPEFKVKTGPLAPSPSSNFYTVPVEVTINGQTDKGPVFVSKDGKTLFR